MQKRFFILLSAVMLLSFWGCRPSGLYSGGTTATTEATETTIPAPNRPKKTQLEFFLEGMAEYQDATLFVGDGYSLYITDDGWEVKHSDRDVTWVCSYNPNITLTVISDAGDTFDFAKNALFAGFTVAEIDGEYVYGYVENIDQYQTARLIETENGILAVVWQYNLEAAEGFGARLHTIAATLEATH